jgi:hypothetical protein
VGAIRGKAPADTPALKPYWGKPAVRNFRGDDGNVGIIRSPVRAIVLPDRNPIVRRIASGSISSGPNGEGALSTSAPRSPMTLKGRPFFRHLRRSPACNAYRPHGFKALHAIGKNRSISKDAVAGQAKSMCRENTLVCFRTAR